MNQPANAKSLWMIVETEPPNRLEQNRVNSVAASGELEGIDKLEQSIAYMKQQLNAPLKIGTLVARANISRFHLYDLFKRYVGYPPIHFFIRLRMERACRLLEETDMSVKAICYTLGYDDPCYFSRVFKSIHRMAPSNYRQLKLRSKSARATFVRQSLERQSLTC